MTQSIASEQLKHEEKWIYMPWPAGRNPYHWVNCLTQYGGECSCFEVTECSEDYKQRLREKSDQWLRENGFTPADRCEIPDPTDPVVQAMFETCQCPDFRAELYRTTRGGRG